MTPETWTIIATGLVILAAIADIQPLHAAPRCERNALERIALRDEMRTENAAMRSEIKEVAG